MNQEKNIIMIAGPNGAGKTTFAREFLPQEADCLTFINADLIAQGLSPFHPEVAVARVADRVAQGGHDIPEPVIRRRFQAGITNFHSLYKPLVDAWRLYDNSADEPSLINSSDKP